MKFPHTALLVPLFLLMQTLSHLCCIGRVSYHDVLHFVSSISEGLEGWRGKPRTFVLGLSLPPSVLCVSSMCPGIHLSTCLSVCCLTEYCGGWGTNALKQDGKRATTAGGSSSSTFHTHTSPRYGPHPTYYSLPNMKQKRKHETIPILKGGASENVS